MSLSVLEVLMNAQINLENVANMNPGLTAHPIFLMAQEQLKNAIAALDENPDANSDFPEQT